MKILKVMRACALCFIFYRLFPKIGLFHVALDTKKCYGHNYLTYFAQCICIQVEAVVICHRALSIRTRRLAHTVTAIIITSTRRGHAVEEHRSFPFTRVIAKVDVLHKTFNDLVPSALFLFSDQFKI